MSVLSRYFSMYRLDVGSTETALNSDFAASIAALPSTPSAMYAEVIAYFGTHYLSSAVFGGACNFSMTYNQSIMGQFSADFQSTHIVIGLAIGMQNFGINGDLGLNETSFTTAVSCNRVCDVALHVADDCYCLPSCV